MDYMGSPTEHFLFIKNSDGDKTGMQNNFPT
jgi:hypothetical protein